MDSRQARPADPDARAQLLRAFEAKGWREMRLEERLHHAGEMEDRPGRRVAFERAPNERPERLAVTNGLAPAELFSPGATLQGATREVGDILDQARELGWALVGLDWEHFHDSEADLTGETFYATFAPLGRPLGRGTRGGRQQIPDETVLRILIAKGEGKGVRRIANELNASGV